VNTFRVLFRELFGDDLLLLSDLTALTHRAFDFDQPLKRAVEVNIRREGNVQQSLAVSKVQVSLELLPTRRKFASIVWGGSVEHSVDTGACNGRLLVASAKGAVNRQSTSDVFKTCLDWLSLFVQCFKSKSVYVQMCR
jgi:hypothetical protein